jgi:hypothetical protein
VTQVQNINQPIMFIKHCTALKSTISLFSCYELKNGGGGVVAVASLGLGIAATTALVVLLVVIVFLVLDRAAMKKALASHSVRDSRSSLDREEEEAHPLKNCAKDDSATSSDNVKTGL